MSDSIPVEIAYARPDKQKIISLRVRPGTTALEAAEISGITLEFPELDLSAAKLGLFGKVFGSKGLPPATEYELQPNDRVEIYRPLLIDPKEVRRRRAEKSKQAKATAGAPGESVEESKSAGENKDVGENKKNRK